VTATSSHPDAPRRVLIIKPSALGDVVTALPVLRGLKRTFPETRVEWLLATSCAPLLADDPELDAVVPFDRHGLGAWWYRPDAHAALWRFWWRLRSGGYDWVIDLQGLLRSGLFARWTHARIRAGFADAREGAPMFYNRRVDVDATHTVERNIELARALGVDARPGDMRLHVAPAAAEAAAGLRQQHDLPDGGYLVCVPPTRWTTKVYPVRHWRRVIEALATELPVVVAGSPSQSDRELCDAVSAGQPRRVVDLGGRTSLPDLVALIAASAGVVASDSAAKFIAPAVDKQCATLMGPTRVDRTGPYLRGRAIAAETACSGCLKKRCRHITCMASISPREVIETVREQIVRPATCPS
jgi:lipopolysaccharide heptosyltransferase I